MSCCICSHRCVAWSRSLPSASFSHSTNHFSSRAACIDDGARHRVHVWGIKTIPYMNKVVELPPAVVIPRGESNLCYGVQSYLNVVTELPQGYKNYFCIPEVDSITAHYAATSCETVHRFITEFTNAVQGRYKLKQYARVTSSFAESSSLASRSLCPINAAVFRSSF